MTLWWRGVVLGLGVVAMGGTSACGKSKQSSNGSGGAAVAAAAGGGGDQAGIFPDATCGERHALCVDAPLCVAAAQITWDYISASSSSVVMRSRIDAEAGPAGELRLDDLTGGDDVKVCAVELPPCASAGVDLDDVNRALANPEMQDILRGGGLYGYRGDAGTVLRIIAETPYIEVGEPCDGRSECRAIEPSLEALATMLRSLTEAALLDARCSGAPPLP